MGDNMVYDQTMRQEDKLRAALKKRDLTAITPEAILKVFEEEGIRSLEDYAKKITEVIQGQQGFSQLIDVDAFSRRSPDPAAASIKHKVPEVPFVMNGVVHDPKDISRFDGRELLYVSGKDVLLVYEDVNAANNLLQTLVLSSQIQGALASDKLMTIKPDGSTPYRFPWQNYEPHLGGLRVMLPPRPTPCPDPFVGLFMYDDLDYSGDLLTLQPGREIPDLTQHHSWPFGGNWNDRISSINAGCDVGIFNEHIDFQGSILFSSDDHHLAEMGWNDRISSVRCIPGGDAQLWHMILGV